MVKKLHLLLLTVTLLLAGMRLTAQPVTVGGKYYTNSEVQQIMTQLQQANPSVMKLHSITSSPGGEPVTILEIGVNLKGVPAVFAGANFEGNNPLSTERALFLAKMLLDSAKYRENRKWFILANPIPDAAKAILPK